MLSPGEGFPVVLSVAVGGDGGDSDAMETIGNGMIVSVDPEGGVHVRTARREPARFFKRGAAANLEPCTKCWAVVVQPPGPGPVAVALYEAPTIPAAWAAFNRDQCTDRFCSRSVEESLDGVPSVQRAPDNLIAACNGDVARALRLSNQFSNTPLDIAALDDSVGELCRTRATFKDAEERLMATIALGASLRAALGRGGRWDTKRVRWPAAGGCSPCRVQRGSPVRRGRGRKCRVYSAFGTAGK